MSFFIELFCVVTLQYQILVRIAIAYFIIEKKKAAPQPWQAIAQRFCSIVICREVAESVKSEVYGGIKMDCLRCKEEMIKAKLKGDAVGTVVYLTNKKNGIFENEKNSTVSCYVCPKCGYVELNADNAKNLI